MNFSKYNNYEKLPAIKAQGECYNSYESIADVIKQKIIENPNAVILIDCYVGVDENEIIINLKKFISFKNIFKSLDCAKSTEDLNEELYDFLTEDRVFGFMCHKKIDFLFDKKKLEVAKQEINKSEGVTLVIGVGASLLVNAPSIHIYSDMARWEIQMRYRRGLTNFNANNESAPVLSKYKRGFFVEWRMCDKHKTENWDNFDYILDTNKSNLPKMISAKTFFEELKKLVYRPFRVTPYFDPGVWGGQWMKDVCGLDKNEKNFAWSFDGVPEENSLNFDFNGNVFEFPAIDLVLKHPNLLLGERVHARFGAEFPIRFDFLDTVSGGNLSLQVHPLTEYIQKTFGMNYTQDESYYILDAVGDETYVYLGLKENVNREELEKDLYSAQKGEIIFDDSKYVNKIKVKKHDHVLIPAGTVHCSGENTMVLEISATPYIFTFKLWDWARLGLDGLPRPTHIEHGMKNIQFNRDTKWVESNLINQTKILKEESDNKIERTGLHEREFIETRRYTTSSKIEIDNLDSVNMANLVDGSSAIIESVNSLFEPFEVHYAETFIVPKAAGTYTIKPKMKNEKVSVIVASVR